MKKKSNGVMEGAEPIFLAGSSGKAVLMIHGFIGTPKDFGDFPYLLHQKGLSVSAPLLPGHGTKPSDFAKTSPRELEAFVLDRYSELKAKYDEVYVAGLSMGGSLAILLASKKPVDKLILAAPYLKIAHQWYYIFPTELYQALFCNLIPYVYKPAMFKQVNKKDSISKIVDYNYVSLKGAGTAIELGRKALQVSKNIESPTLILYGKGDKATDYKESVRLADVLKKNPRSRFVSLPRSNHMIFWDYDADVVEQEILKFVSE